MPYTLKFKHRFHGAHRLINYDGPCANLHGHTWKVEVVIHTDELVNDMVADFNLIETIVDELDHKYLNEVVDFNPTAENLAKYLKDKIDAATGRPSEVTVWESPNASITYK